MKRTGIMGGTFNPVHLAHLVLAEAAFEYFDLDDVMFLPSKRPAYKAQSEILPDRQRYEMLELAIRDNNHFFLSDLELSRGEGATYTADTVLELKYMEPDTEFYFIIGGDSLMSFEHWSRPEIVLQCVHLAATGRPGLGWARLLEKADMLCLKYGADVQVFPTPAMEISSSDSRERIRCKSSVRYLVPDPVREYISKHGCYRKE